MPSPKKTPPTSDTPTPTITTDVDPAVVSAGTNAYGVDLNDPSLKGGTDNPEAQARNEAEMNAQAGTDRPVVEQIADPAPNDEEADGRKAAHDASKDDKNDKK